MFFLCYGSLDSAISSKFLCKNIHWQDEKTTDEKLLLSYNPRTSGTYLEHCKTSRMKLCSKISNGLTILTKSLILRFLTRVLNMVTQMVQHSFSFTICVLPYLYSVLSHLYSVSSCLVSPYLFLVSFTFSLIYSVSSYVYSVSCYFYSVSSYLYSVLPYLYSVSS